MCLFFMRATAVLNLVKIVSGDLSNVLRRQARSLSCSDASTGKILGSACLPWEMHSPWFKVFYDLHLN